MHREKLVLSASPPRNYTLRQAYQGRVWRTPVAVLSREVAFWGLGLLLVGIALNHQTVTWMGAAMASTLAVIGLLASLLRNHRRVRVIKTGVGTKATLSRSRRIPLFHELVRGRRESTYRLPYSFIDEMGVTHHSSIWLCGCARDLLPSGSRELIAYDPARPEHSILLRVAVMVAPH